MQRLGLIGLFLALNSVSYAQMSFDSQLDYEATGYFADSKLAANDTRLNNSVSLLSEVYTEVGDGQSVVFKPFLRWDEHDDERTHFDIRELIWHQYADNYELKAGIGKVFWGVTESQHLVDIINQTDGVESLDGEQKLGQPMVQLLLERDWGNLDLFVLPYHRERTQIGKYGRLGLGQDYGDARYESSDKESNIDIAARFYTYIDELEYAVSVFYGTSREPVLGFDSSFTPFSYYPVVTQLGLEMQYLAEGWAWKFEGVVREGMPENSINTPLGNLGAFDGGLGLELGNSDQYFATTAGFEYTQVGIWETRIDLGWVVEHLFDSRQDEASGFVFEHDVLLATRWAANDAASSTLLAGVLVDYEDGDYSLSVEGNTRLLQNMTMAIEARVFAPKDNKSSLWSFRDEDFVKLTFSYYL